MVVLGNGRKDCISQAIPSARKHLLGVDRMVIVDDTGDAAYREWLADEFYCQVIPVADGERAGYWRAMRKVWEVAAKAAYLAFVEEDFVFNEEVPLWDLQGVLSEHPYLTQIALVRQPWFGNEHRHGGLIEALEAQGNHFQERTDGVHHWIEHRACFTGNPSLIPARTFSKTWPEGDWSESRFGRELFRDRKARGAYWGRRGDAPRVTHIGVRSGHGY